MTMTDILDDQTQPVTEQFSVGPVLAKVLKPLASLKLTVALLAAAIFIVLTGTLAQVDKDIWQVVDEYFRCAIAFIPFKVFCPPAFFSGPPPQPSGGFWFPGGWLIGFLMSVNLAAAHGLRFKPQAKGGRLWGGIGVLAMGAVATWIVVVTGSNADGVQTESWVSWDALWLLFKLGLTVLDVGLIVWVTRLSRDLGPSRFVNSLKFWGGLGLLLLQAGVTGWLWFEGKDAQLDASSMRILWQLLKGTFAGVVLLVGCGMVFKKRAGIVLLHGGIGLMMFSELLVGLTAVESQISLQEGERSNFARDTRSFELAVVEANGDEETHTIIPSGMLISSFKTPEISWYLKIIEFVLQREVFVRQEAPKVSDPQLPFDLKVTEFFTNASVRRAGPVEKKPATHGVGAAALIEELPPSTGTSSAGGVDYPAAYVTLTKKGTDEEIGKYLTSARMTEGMGISDTLELDGKTYSLGLRFQRLYKPYVIELKDVSKTDYIGTSTPRDYSSHVLFTQDARQKDFKEFEYHVWMNNPLRYAGETFYQSGYDDGVITRTGIEGTTLQVVTNSGWMIPYVSCMIVAVGMLAQFGLTLLRFLDRHARDTITSDANRLAGGVRPTVSRSKTSEVSADFRSPESSAIGNGWTKWVPWIAVAVLALYVGYKARPPKAGPEEFNYAEFGKIPIAAAGRVKPIDTYARNTLRIISGLEAFKLKPEDKKTQPAVRWLLDTICRPEDAVKYRVIRIENLDVIRALGLTNRKGFRYAVNEFDAKKLAERADKAREKMREMGKDKEPLSLSDRKVLEFEKKYGQYDTLSMMREAPMPNRGGREDLLAAFELHRFLEGRSMPLLVPPADGAQRKDLQDDWLPLSLAGFLTPIEADENHVEWATDSVAALAEARQRGQIPPEAEGRVLEFESWIKLRYGSRPDGSHPVKAVAENPAVTAWNKILSAYSAGDVKSFNEAVVDYRKSFQGRSLREFNPTKVGFEWFFNHFQPFFLASMCYFFVFLTACCSFLGWNRTLSRTAFAMTLFTLGLHTAALIARIYISGRPPVTNLYTTAVFIGWGMAVLAVLLEIVYRLGIGNVLAGVTGFMTLLIAHFLGNDGDTFTQLQAVLDTQFWLATHVTTINLGYATTLLAGFLGIFFVAMQRPGLFAVGSLLAVGHVCYHMPNDVAKWLDSFLGWEVGADAVGNTSIVAVVAVVALVAWKRRSLLNWHLTDELGKTLGRMIYGALCFAIFFSFVGTVLGGLWADDSWGRFWGWDPKENGALMIVLWNALVLHARWGGMVKERGLALLTMLGNIVNGWSWFGVNELGVGLHSYGFTEGVLMVLGLFALSQIGLVVLGLLPKDLFGFAKNEVV